MKQSLEVTSSGLLSSWSPWSPNGASGGRIHGTLLRIECRPVELLWVQPIKTAELTVNRQHGIDALLDLSAQRRLPFVLDGRRPSLV